MHLFRKALLLVISFAAFSCSLIEDLSPDEQPDKVAYKIRSSKYYFSDKTFDEIKYIYNAANRLSQKKWYNSENEINFHENFEYNNDQLIRIERSVNTGEFAEARFTYENGKVKTAEYWMQDEQTGLQKLHVSTYEYTNGFVSKSTTFFFNNEPAAYALYTYDNGNVTTVKSYDLATHQLMEESKFSYDQYANPFYNISNQYLGSPVTSSKNNIIRHQAHSYKQNAQNTDITYEYTYNKEGYPLEKYLLGKDQKRYLDESYSYTN